MAGTNPAYREGDAAMLAKARTKTEGDCGMLLISKRLRTQQLRAIGWRCCWRSHVSEETLSGSFHRAINLMQ
jgi:hypothetical protein